MERDMETNYIQIMIESLEKKKEVLGRIIDLNRQQNIFLQDMNLQPEEFEKNMEYKSNLVEQLTLLDSGFEKLYEKVRAELQENRAKYQSEIAKMQSLIRDISAQTNMIQTQEQRSKQQVEQKFADVRKQVRGVRSSQKVVQQYYQNMLHQKNADSSVIDNKK
jgi:chromosome segregation ATPase